MPATDHPGALELLKIPSLIKKIETKQVTELAKLFRAKKREPLLH
jgi:hypothetical protein